MRLDDEPGKVIDVAFDSGFVMCRTSTVPSAPSSVSAPPGTARAVAHETSGRRPLRSYRELFYSVEERFVYDSATLTAAA